jgi:hypothetical protein
MKLNSKLKHQENMQFILNLCEFYYNAEAFLFIF